MKDPTVISLGGSLIVPEVIDVNFLRNFRKLILDFVEKDFNFLIVAGGGKICRVYQDAARKITDLDDEDVDWLGIHVTHLNAQLLRSIFGEKAHLKILTHHDQREEIDYPIAIAAGWKPGHSTDFDSVMFARLYGSKTVINLSDIDFVYDKDPDKSADAKPFKTLGWEDYRKMSGDTWEPGKNLPFDPIAAKAAQENGMKVIVMNGHNLESFKNYLEEKPFEGTTLS